LSYLFLKDNSLSATRYLVYLEVLVLSLFARLFVVSFPLSAISKRLTRTSEKVEVAQDISSLVIAVSKVSKYIPWRCKCYEQGIILKLMLNRRHVESTLLFGVSQSVEGKLSAHAWVKCGDEVVLGGGNLASFKVIASFT
jgi:hypothetical protein